MSGSKVGDYEIDLVPLRRRLPSSSCTKRWSCIWPTNVKEATRPRVVAKSRVRPRRCIVRRGRGMRAWVPSGLRCAVAAVMPIRVNLGPITIGFLERPFRRRRGWQSLPSSKAEVWSWSIVSSLMPPRRRSWPRPQGARSVGCYGYSGDGKLGSECLQKWA